MKGQGMLRATRPERTLARTAEVRGFGFFHGADVTLRFSPADAGTGVVFVRTDLPDRPAVPARLDTVVPSQRRTTIRQGRGGRRDDRTCDGRPGRPADRQLHRSRSMRANARAATVPARLSSRCWIGPGSSNRAGCGQALVLDRSVSVVEGDAILAAHPGVPGRIDAFLSPRLWPWLADFTPELLSGLVPADVPR